MRKILFACVLLVGTSSAGFADEYMVSLLVDCKKHNSVKACEEGAKLACGYGIRFGNYMTSCKDDPNKHCFTDDAPKEIYYINNLLCGSFRLMVGLNLYDKGDFIGAKKEFEAAINLGEIKAQKAMGMLCSEQSWVCNRSTTGLQ